MNGGRGGSARRLCHAAAAAVYLAVVLFVMRAVLPDPSRLLPFPAMLHATQWFRSNVLELDRQDQGMVVATVTRNAHLLTHAPGDLFGDGQCHPMPRSYTLGEHMFGTGLLAALPYAWTGDPIASFNAALALGLWIAPLAMYALVFHFTRSPAAAFAGGLAFLLAPPRIANPAHPYVYADHWTPLVLLFLHRVFTRRRFADALGLGLFASLQVLESLYPLLVCLLYVLTFAAHLLVRHRDRPIRPVLLLGLAALPAAATALVVLGPYLETRAVWGILGDRATFFLLPRELAPGQFHFVGWTVLVLAAVALVDAVRRPAGDDPRLALAVGAVLVAWCAVGKVDVLGVAVPSPFAALRGVVPGLDAVRAMRATASGVDVGMAFLVGTGTAALLRGRSPRAALALTAAVALALLALPSYGPLARATFGRLVRLDAWEARPPAEDVRLLRETARGAVLDYPLPRADAGSHSLGAGRLLLFSSYSPRPTATCYNSFVPPTTEEVGRLVTALPDAAAARALAALGFATVVVHKDRIDRDERAEVTAALAAAQGVLALAGETDRIAVYHLPAPPETTEDPAALAPAPVASVRVARGAPVELDLAVVNRAERTFRHARPLRPTELELLWIPRDGPPSERVSLRALLPLALAPGDVAPLHLRARAPERPGLYRIEARAVHAGVKLAEGDVEVVAAEG